MYAFEEQLSAKVAVAKIWALYSNVDCWPEWNEAINSVELDGPFENGCTGVIQVLIAPPLTFKLENVVENESFDLVTGLGDIKVVMQQRLRDDGQGECTIKHALVIEGGNPAMLQTVGSMLSANIMGSMRLLVEMAA